MTRKDYEAIADAIHANLTHHPRIGHNAAVSAVARKIADVFAADNNQFNAERFYTACGLYPDGYDWNTKETNA